MKKFGFCLTLLLGVWVLNKKSTVYKTPNAEHPVNMLKGLNTSIILLKTK